MPQIDRRSQLYGFGIVSPLLLAQTAARRVAVAKPGESRYRFTHPQLTPGCMVTGQDCAGTISMFQFTIPHSCFLLSTRKGEST
jgi:hypothetical protein